MDDAATCPSLRLATSDEASALKDLEKAANLVALAHVFPADQYPYPDADVLARWRDVLADPGTTTLVGEDEQGLTCFVAFDALRLRHLGVRPDLWGSGLAAVAFEASTATRLWCLEANHRARRFYARHGWQATGVSRTSEFPPFPVEVEYHRA
ncbi:GNAT family N-acetyltransferase [Pedococcus sp. KACC 23699]|uniref:GNAT family N-acetyltransferase n=1 Tax=Pedococcus sp. KACC 23699 TaxID=3149228 RepID=A0AAU7JWT6_9MICO